MQQPKSWQTVTFRAMGSHINLWLDSADTAWLAAFELVEELFRSNEEALSRFREDSELSQLNRHSGEWFPVSLLLWEVLQAAVDMAAATGGLFDPTILDALEFAGYTQSFEVLTTAVNYNPHFKNNHHVGAWRDIRFDSLNQRVLLPPGSRIDLGGIAKGFTAQQAVDILNQYGPCLVDAGGDLTAGTAPYGFAGWPVAVAAPKTDVEPLDLFTLWLAEGSLATSGIDYRHWLRNGRTVHHLIDPFSGQPAETDVITTTVLAKEATTAEAWATAALIGGTTTGMAHLVANQFPAVMITCNNKLMLTPAMADKLTELQQMWNLG